MAIGNIVGNSYPATNVSVGLALMNGTNLDYTESQLLNLGTITITSYNPVNNLLNFQFSNDLTQIITGTLMGNTTDAFIFSAVIPGLFPTPISVYITNTPQPASGERVTIPNEATAPLYVACYGRGTMIGTPDGERAVEELQAGDLVRCVNGGVAPVRWVGQRSYAGRFLRANRQLQPVRFRAGSLGAGLPARDLLVSPQHAMLIDGVLVAAELLVNGTTIVADQDAETVHYFHIELAHHDAVWAEGVPSETFVDDNSRTMFHNAASFADMYPDAAKAAPVFCAPRVDGGPVLAAIRARLSGDAAVLPIAA